MSGKWLALRGEWWGLVGLIADVIVDWATALQNLANRRFRAVIDEEVARDIPPGFDARKVADKVRERLEAVGEWTDDDGVQLRMRDGRVERIIPPAACNCIVVRDLVRERYVWMHGLFGDCGHPPTGTPVTEKFQRGVADE